MSTYLVAVVVGEYDYVEDTSNDGVLVRVYTPLGKKEQGLFALDVATKVLPYYKEYFNIAYPLPKMDLIAIADFSAGAMENWGIVTYRETMLLVDPENTSVIRKQTIALTVGHEIAHQWFGNLGKNLKSFFTNQFGSINRFSFLKHLQLRWNGGRVYGSTRAMHRSWNSYVSIDCFPNTIFGHSSLQICTQTP